MSVVKNNYMPDALLVSHPPITFVRGGFPCPVPAQSHHPPGAQADSMMLLYARAREVGFLQPHTHTFVMLLILNLDLFAF